MEKGEVVQLVSGGPKMAVLGESLSNGDIFGNDKVTCVWFDFKGRLHQDTFYKACLDRVGVDGRE